MIREELACLVPFRTQQNKTKQKQNIGPQTSKETCPCASSSGDEGRRERIGSESTKDQAATSAAATAAGPSTWPPLAAAAATAAAAEALASASVAASVGARARRRARRRSARRHIAARSCPAGPKKHGDSPAARRAASRAMAARRAMACARRTRVNFNDTFIPSQPVTLDPKAEGPADIYIYIYIYILLGPWFLGPLPSRYQTNTSLAASPKCRLKP